MKTVFLFAFLFTFVNAGNSQSLYKYYLDLSHQYTYNGDYEKALLYSQKAMNKYPDSALCYFERGGAYYFMDSLDEAYSDLDQYVRMKPNDAKGYEWRGNILLKSRVFNEAESDFEKSIKLGTSTKFIRKNLAEARLFQDKFDLAEKDLKELIKIDPKSSSYHNLLGLLYERKEDYPASINAFSNGISINPEMNPSLYYNRGRVFNENGDKDAACKDWYKAQSLGIRDAEIWLDANNCKLQKGLNKADLAFDKLEKNKSKKLDKISFEITANYFPMLPHARYTYQSENDGIVDTAAMTVLYDDYKSKNYYFDLWNGGRSGIDRLFFRLASSNNFHYENDQLDVRMRNEYFQLVSIPFFPREFQLGEELTIENTWNPNGKYAIENIGLTFAGIETLDLPAGEFDECIKLRVLIREKNGRHTLSYLWLKKDFGLVQWRNEAGEIWHLSRYAVPEYGSFPEKEYKYLLPPPRDVSSPKK